METKKTLKEILHVRNLWYYNCWGGPVGLFAAFLWQYALFKSQTDWFLTSTGRQPAILYPEKSILDVPGFYSIWLVKNWATAWSTSQTVWYNWLFSPVEDIQKKAIFHYHYFSPNASTKVVIIMGGGAFKPRALDIEGAEDFDNVHYRVSNIQQ